MAEPPIHTGVDEVSPHPHHTGHRWLDMSLGLSAIAISVISLFVAIQHGKTEEKLVAASSWPFIFAQTSSSGLVEGARVFTLTVANGGVGPARIQSARILLDGKPMHDRIELLNQCCGFSSGDGGDVAAQIRDGLRTENRIVGVLTARDSADIISMQQTPATLAQWKKLSEIQRRLTMSACYCSVLDECWTTDLRETSTPQRVARCAPGADDYNQ